MCFTDATNANEAVNLQNRLRSLSSGLVGLRNCMPELAAMNHDGDASKVEGGGIPAPGGVRSAVAAFENGHLPASQQPYQNHQPG